MKRVLFLDRDGTILVNPPDEQVDSLEKLAFLPRVISSLQMLMEHGYELVMVTNQDGRGTASFPEEHFAVPHEKMLSILKNEGVVFKHVFVDSSFPEDKSPNRKPGIGMLKPYLSTEKIDLERSFVIGDRATDVEMARKIGCKAIFIGKERHGADFASESWVEISRYLLQGAERTAEVRRNTKETKITVVLNLDGNGEHEIRTGLNFLNHLLEQFTRHSGIDLTLRAEGDLHVDEHHTIEDTAIVLGDALKKALGEKRGIRRYGCFTLPTDEALAACALDLSGRPWLEFKGKFNRKMVGDFPAEMIEHWLSTFAHHAGLTLHVQVEGKNAHHQLESVFKALGKAVREAVRLEGADLPTTKGVL